MVNENTNIYMLYDDRGNPIISLVRIIEKYNISAKVKVLKCYEDNQFGLFRYLASHNGETNVSLKYLHDITDYIDDFDLTAICEMFNEFFGCDGMYYGVDTYGMALDICRYFYER